MPSITIWNRLEPSMRARSIAESLAARLADPLWLLTRQWQLGEFRAEDAGSPAVVEISGAFSPLVVQSSAGASTAPLSNDEPIERTLFAEGWSPSLAMRVELGQTFERLLADEGLAELTREFRAAFAVDIAEANALDPADREALELLTVCASRMIDGLALLDAAMRGVLPPSLSVPPASRDAVSRTLARLVSTAAEVWGPIGRSDASTWRPDTLRYASASGGTFEVHATAAAECDWFAFDRSATSPNAGAAGASSFRRRVVPAHVRARGIPNARFWDFESSPSDIAELRPDSRDLGHLMMVDFMLLQSNDWFLVPLEQPVGTACRIESVRVHDVFGNVTEVRAADLPTPERGAPWTMFRPRRRADGSVEPVLIVPHSSGPIAVDGPVLEEVALIRDDRAHVLWAIERSIEGAAGQPLRANERESSILRSADARGLLPRYRVQSHVPVAYVPFVAVPGADELVRAELEEEGARGLGRVLAASTKIAATEMSNLGVTIARVVVRARSADGGTHTWIQRRSGYGSTELGSPLAFDFIE